MYASSPYRISWEPLLIGLLAVVLESNLMVAGAALAAPPPDASAARADASTLLAKFLDGPLRDVESVVFAARALNPTDGHWYANFGYYSHDPDRKAYAEGTKLYRLNLRTRTLTTLLADTTGGVRDPQVSYDGRKILFSYRPGGTEHYHLYEMNADGSGIHQLTSGNFDDIEAAYLPDGGIVFVSSRCKRWVNCWLTQVAVLHRCDADGSNIRALSSNNEHDNTPWPRPDIQPQLLHAHHRAPVCRRPQPTQKQL